MAQESVRQSSLLAQWSSTDVSAAATAPGWIRQLVLAADQFIVKRPLPEEPDGRSIIAGYHWFADWGRDTMIALPGLTLTTGRADIARKILLAFARYVDGGIIGTPGALRIYLSGADANAVAGLLGATVVSNASALKIAYAAWTKGTAALILAIRDLAEAEGIGDELRDEWRLSQPQLFDRLASAERSASAKGWRWVGEMKEIADTFAADGLPDGFHRAAAEVFRVR